MPEVKRRLRGRGWSYMEENKKVYTRFRSCS